MKKIIIFLLPILLTGCVNGNRDFETICRQNTTANGFTNSINYKIYSNSEHEITKLVETYELSYEDNTLGKSSFDAVKSSLNSYGQSRNCTINVIEDSKNKYVVSFTFDIKNLSDEYLSTILKLNRDFYKQKGIYEENMTCSKK